MAKTKEKKKVVKKEEEESDENSKENEKKIKVKDGTKPIEDKKDNYEKKPSEKLKKREAPQTDIYTINQPILSKNENPNTNNRRKARGTEDI